MSPKRTKQSSITSMGFPVVQKPTEMCVGRQSDQVSWILLERVNVKWRSEFTVPVHCSRLSCVTQWDTGGTPSQTMEPQEMGVDGQVIGNDSRETGGSSSDRIFFSTRCLSYNTGTEPFPQHSRTQRPPVLQMFPPHLLVCTQTWQGKSARETLNPSSRTCPPARLLS